MSLACRYSVHVAIVRRESNSSQAESSFTNHESKQTRTAMRTKVSISYPGAPERMGMPASLLASTMAFAVSALGQRRECPVEGGQDGDETSSERGRIWLRQMLSPWQGKAMQGRGEARRGQARRGEARRGKTKQGEARRGSKYEARRG